MSAGIHIKKSIVTYPLKDQSEAIKEAAELAAVNLKTSEDTDIASLLDSTLEILRREVRHLLMDSAGGKLSKDSSTALVNYVKLLKELHENEKDIVESMTEEELKELQSEKK